jgi:hypothetical protein
MRLGTLFRSSRFRAGALAGLGAVALLLMTLAPVPAATALPSVTVYLSPTCGCCKKWVKHLRDNGFEVKVEEMNDVSPMKNSAGVPSDLWSCHTAVVGGYAIEGHVPAADIKRLLSEHPKILGLSAPGMPSAAPGMDGKPEAYEVIAFGKGGEQVYAKH